MAKKENQKNRQNPCRRHIDSASGVEHVVDGFMDQAPERVAQSGNRHQSERPPRARGQKIERKDKKLIDVYSDMPGRKKEV